MKGIFNRTELLLGNEVMARIQSARVIIFGVGGVGSWCAESLIRSGIMHLTIVDSDRVCVTNVNRQLMATTQTVGKVKVEVLRERLLEINPNADIQALQKIYSAETKDDFAMDSYDYIIDAIDSLQNKILLIQEATRTGAVFFSSMGAALKIDPAKIQVAEFWKIKGCTLAAALRQRFRKMAADVENIRPLPAKKFLCVFSEERLENQGTVAPCNEERICPQNPNEQKWCSLKAQTNGSLSHITAIFGFTLAGLVMQNIYEKIKQK
ncbi:MAG: tRNA threonylcarbamoyladenosine dehydratase [Prevotellaceae bacterium]|jgi:tRNA A37 threonylcarbamoyladenosine dehydratase|nr:tRNA threonylcarbamoyladenosine dehydratase [Prevotellaceae bacterium]